MRDADTAAPKCGESTVGFRLRQGSPPTFFLQPHYLAMTSEDFAHWLKILRREFPSKWFHLDSVGVYWYPGDDSSQVHELRRAAHIGTVNGYSLHVANRSPDDERIRVGVQEGQGEAY